jgi:hypothetical protein
MRGALTEITTLANPQRCYPAEDHLRPCYDWHDLSQD